MTVVLLVAILLHRVTPVSLLPPTYVPWVLQPFRGRVNPFSQLTSFHGTRQFACSLSQGDPLSGFLLPRIEVREFGDNGKSAARLIVDYKLGLFSLNAAFPGTLSATTLFSVCTLLTLGEILEKQVPRSIKCESRKTVYGQINLRAPQILHLFKSMRIQYFDYYGHKNCDVLIKINYKI